MGKRVFVIHAWGEEPESCWYPWLRAELEARGFEVFVPVMPKPEAPEIEAWVSAVVQTVGSPDENAIFIGHSIGCQTILRYLAQLPKGTCVGGVFFVAPCTHLTNLDAESQKIAKPWLETPIDWQAAKAHCPKFAALFSDNDEWVPLSEEKIFRKNLSAKTQIIPFSGHFDEMEKLPEILSEISNE